MSLEEFKQRFSHCKYCKHKLFSDYFLGIIYRICHDKVDSLKSLASDLQVEEGTIRRYLFDIRKKIGENLEFYAQLTKGLAGFDLSLLWKQHDDYMEISKQIKIYQK